MLDARLREFGEQQLSINALLYLASHYMDAENRPENFLACLHQWQEIFNNLPKTQTAHQWAKTFSKLLMLFNWPGERKLTSNEYQTVQVWQDVLGQFASFDLISPSLNYSAALRQLCQLASAFSFQPETPEVPVQVLGVSGAAGMQFDHLWIMGLNEEVWPEMVEPNPFIPIAMQREAQLPNASAEIKLAHARNMTQRLVSSSPDIILSYPQIEKERPLRPSPLIKPYLRTDIDHYIKRTAAYVTKLYGSQQFENVKDDEAPAIPAGQSARGGASLFKDQAACPFRAFARHRLNTRGLMSADIGLNAMDRGLIIHQLMQQLWQKLGGHKALLAQGEAELNTLIEDVIDTVLTQYKKQRPKTFTERFTYLEAQRLDILLKEWLNIERERMPFTVHACEQEHVSIINDIEVCTRIDRVDQLADGQHVITDYKTGDARLASWFDDRPDEPQLPLYAISSEGEVAAIVFAKLKRGEATYIGLANDESILPNVNTLNNSRLTRDIDDWSMLFTQWRESLGRLAEAFHQGDARVDPKDNNSCRYCDLHAFCRIYENNGVRSEG